MSLLETTNLIIATAIAMAVALWIPLALNMLQLEHRNDPRKNLTSLAERLVLPAAGTALISLLLPTGILSGILAVPWVLFSLYLAMLSAVRFLHHGFVRAEEVIMEVGSVLIAGASIWFLASRSGYRLLDFPEPWLGLTANHFYYIGLFFWTVGAAGRLINPGAGSLRFLYAFSCGGMVIAFPLVAQGINHHPVMERIGVALLVASMGVFLIVLCSLVFDAGLSHRIRWLCGVASLVMIVSMSLTLIYRFELLLPITVRQMVASHGALNAFLFVPLLVVAMRIANPKARVCQLGIPFSGLFGDRKVGHDFFIRTGAEQNELPAPAGLIDCMEDFNRSDFDVARLSENIKMFYERTCDHSLTVEAQWSPLFRPLWLGIGAPFFSAVGQMSLPSSDLAIDSRMVALKSDFDRRLKLRGWVRTISDTNKAIYVAAYAQHNNQGHTYMNIAFPLPLCNMTSVLRMDILCTPEKGNLVTEVGSANSSDAQQLSLMLSSVPRRDFSGDEGVYLVTPLLSIRLPINETIIVSNGGELTARHDMWFCGLKFLTLDYKIHRSQS